MGAAQKRRANTIAKSFIAWAEHLRTIGMLEGRQWPKGVLLTSEERRARDRGVAYNGKPTFYQRHPRTIRNPGRGFTLIEVLIVLAIAGLLATGIMGLRQSAQHAQAAAPTAPTSYTEPATVVPVGWSSDALPALRRVQDPGTGWTCWVAGTGNHPGGLFCADLRASPAAVPAERAP